MLTLYLNSDDKRQMVVASGFELEEEGTVLLHLSPQRGSVDIRDSYKSISIENWEFKDGWQRVSALKLSPASFVNCLVARDTYSVRFRYDTARQDNKPYRLKAKRNHLDTPTNRITKIAHDNKPSA